MHIFVGIGKPTAAVSSAVVQVLEFIVTVHTYGFFKKLNRGGGRMGHSGTEKPLPTRMPENMALKRKVEGKTSVCYIPSENK